MYRRAYILLMIAMTGLTACQGEQDVMEAENNATQPVAVDMLMSVPQPFVGLTRMATDVVQADGNYRGITDVCIIPFTDGYVTARSVPQSYMVTGVETHPRERVFLYKKCTLMSGTRSVLCYGKAPEMEGVGPAVNGKLQASFPVTYFPTGITTTEKMYPSAITFTPVPIHPDEEVPEAGAEIANYLTSIARANGWSNTVGSLKDLYEGFVGQTNEGGMLLLCGSYASVKAHVEHLKTKLNALPSLTGTDAAVRENVLQAIGDGLTVSRDYPSSLGLPDGAAVVRWSAPDRMFVPLTEHSTVADINAMNRFVYPAELYYFANSRLATSRDSLADLVLDRPAANWETDILSQYGTEPVTSDTRSVVVRDQIHYAVACLKVKLKKTESDQLADSEGKLVDVMEGACPLTGIIVNGQRKADFAFVPTSDVLDENDYFVYDHHLNDVFLSSVADQSPTYTLLLQSPNSMKLNVVLEFENNISDFKGKDGIVYKGSKFYLVGVIDPMETDHPRVLTKDETTTLNVSVTSLAEAYNVMPSLLAPRMEIGIMLDPQWNHISPISVELY